MKVKFYTFTKKYNSTAQPSGGTEYDCVLKTSSSVINPTIELQLGLSSNPSAFNYCYISAYGRYYWIREWTFSSRLWIASCDVDVLATWKTYIGNTDMYVYRSSTQYDGSILDVKYPTTSNVTLSKQAIAAVNKKFSDGWFVVGIYGSGVGHGGSQVNTYSMSYYCFSAVNFANFLRELYTTCLDGSNWASLAVGLANAVFDVAGYIKCCYWTPYNPSYPNSEGYHIIKIGIIEVVASCFPLNMTAEGHTTETSLQISIPKHPQARTRGKYCNITPYTRYYLTYLPFGVCELDSTKLVDCTHMLLTVEMDGITGEGVLTATGQKLENGSYVDVCNVLVRSAKYSVDIPIGALVSNVGGFLGKGAMATVSGTRGNIAGARLSAIAAVTDLAIPHLEEAVNVRSGVLSIDYDQNMLLGQFFEIVDEDNNGNGRPLCKVKKPSALGGYIEGTSNMFSAPATTTEMEEIKRFIDNGFYYE